LINNGWLSLTGSSSRFVRGSGVLTNNGRIIHTGSSSLSLASGTSLVNNGFYDLQGDVSVGGQQGGTFQNNGTFIKSQGAGTSTNTSWVNNSGGTIDLESGMLRLTDSFTNNGTLIIATGMTFQVGGNYTQGASGTLIVQLAGTDPSQFSHLHVDGSVILAGTLSVSLLAPFVPNPGDSFQVLTFGGRPGDTAFDTYMGLDLGGGLRLDPQYDSLGLTLVTAN
jgi:hypothetical protein